jgi:pimeloyl-ACP methyl ester carboxylesterase
VNGRLVAALADRYRIERELGQGGMNLLIACIIVLATVGATSAQERTRGDFDADGGVRIHYEIIGEGPPVVLLHGFGASMSGSPMPKTILTGVAGHRLIGMDIRGFGMSGRPDGPGSYGIETTRDVIRLLDHLGIRQADLFGFSMGGIIALKTAALYPDRIRSLVLGGQGWASLEDLQQMGRAAAELASRDTSALSPEERATLERLGRQAFGGFAAAYPALFVTPDELTHIACPVLAVLGGDDERVQRAEALRERVPQTQVVIIPGHGHADVVADTLFGQAIARFYRDNESERNR